MPSAKMPSLASIRKRLSILPIMRSPKRGYVRLPMKASQREEGIGDSAIKTAPPSHFLPYFGAI